MSKWHIYLRSFMTSFLIWVTFSLFLGTKLSTSVYLVMYPMTSLKERDAVVSVRWKAGSKELNLYAALFTCVGEHCITSRYYWLERCEPVYIFWNSGWIVFCKVYCCEIWNLNHQGFVHCPKRWLRICDFKFFDDVHFAKVQQVFLFGHHLSGDFSI